MKEIWKDIPDYEGIYQISSIGRVKSLPRKRCPREKILKNILDGCGYYHVALSKNKTIKWEMVHRLVAKAFIGNPNNYDVINHKDGNKTNNTIGNLEWCTHYDNLHHAMNNNLNPHIKKERPIQKIDKNTLEVLVEYPSASYAARELGNIKFVNNITAAARGERKTSYGYIWKYC